jgi:hypothetical protein
MPKAEIAARRESRLTNRESDAVFKVARVQFPGIGTPGQRGRIPSVTWHAAFLFTTETRRKPKPFSRRSTQMNAERNAMLILVIAICNLGSILISVDLR